MKQLPGIITDEEIDLFISFQDFMNVPAENIVNHKTVHNWYIKKFRGLQAIREVTAEMLAEKVSKSRIEKTIREE